MPSRAELGREVGGETGRELGREPGRELGRDPGREVGGEEASDRGGDPGGVPRRSRSQPMTSPPAMYSHQMQPTQITGLRTLLDSAPAFAH